MWSLFLVSQLSRIAKCAVRCLLQISYLQKYRSPGSSVKQANSSSSILRAAFPYEEEIFLQGIKAYVTMCHEAKITEMPWLGINRQFWFIQFPPADVLTYLSWNPQHCFWFPARQACFYHVLLNSLVSPSCSYGGYMSTSSICRVSLTGQSWDLHLRLRLNNCTCLKLKINETWPHTHKHISVFPAAQMWLKAFDCLVFLFTRKMEV